MKKIKEKPEEIKHVIKAGIKAAHYIRQTRKDSVQLMMELDEGRWGNDDSNL